jgi:FkbH-like protein
VLTLEWPHDDAKAIALLEHTWEFDTGVGTAEDQRRTQMYREEAERQASRDDALTFADFIDALQLDVENAPVAPADLRRASQLTLRTNQFNFTTIRRDEGDLTTLLADGRHDVRSVRVRDRFGDYGLVGLLILEREPETWRLDTFLLSCRVLGRGVEHRMAAAAGQLAVEAGATSVRVRVEPTPRNTPARAFFDAIVPAQVRRKDDAAVHADLAATDLAADGPAFQLAVLAEVAALDRGN